MRFFPNRDLNYTKEFLSPYQDGPVYIYHSKNRWNYLGMEKFNNECFEKIVDGQAEVYRYVCGGW